MLFEYCAQCGGKTAVTSIKPRFCSSCGTPFCQTQAAVTPVTPKPKKQPVVEIDDDEDDIEDDTDLDFEDEDDVRDVPALKGNPFEIEITKPQTIKISDIAAGKKISPIEKQKGIKFSKKKVLEQFKKDAGTLRDNKL